MVYIMDGIQSVSLESVAPPLQVEDGVPNISIYSMAQLVTSIVGRGSPEDMVDRIESFDQRFRTIVNKLDSAARLLHPIHTHMVERNIITEEYFNYLIRLMDPVYSPDYESPRENLEILRDNAILLYIGIYNINTSSAEMESILAASASPWQVYQIMVNLCHLSTVYPHDVERYGNAGLSSDTDVLIVSATKPCSPKYYNNPNSEEVIVYNLYGLLKNPEDEFRGSVEDVEALRAAMQSTVPMKSGQLVERCEEADVILRLAPHSTGRADSGLAMCAMCSDICTIYSPACNHFIACAECFDQYARDDDNTCHVCDKPWLVNNIFIKVGSITGVLGIKPIDTAEICKIIAPGRTFSDAVYRTTYTAENNITHIVTITRYICQVTYSPIDIMLDVAATWISDQHFAQGIKETLWFVGEDYVAGDDFVYGIVVTDSVEEFIERYPDHTVEQVVNLVVFDSIYKCSDNDECISCLDTKELFVMSECGHQSSCMDCIKITGSRCPICRSESNWPMRLM